MAVTWTDTTVTVPVADLPPVRQNGKGFLMTDHASVPATTDPAELERIALEYLALARYGTTNVVLDPAQVAALEKIVNAVSPPVAPATAAQVAKRMLRRGVRVDRGA